MVFMVVVDVTVGSLGPGPAELCGDVVVLIILDDDCGLVPPSPGGDPMVITLDEDEEFVEELKWLSGGENGGSDPESGGESGSWWPLVNCVWW